MDFRERVQPSDWVAGIGALILLISVFLSWYSVSGIGISGWDGTKWSILVLLCAMGAIAIVVLRVVDVDLGALPFPIAYVMLGLGGLSTLIVVLKILLRPGGSLLGAVYRVGISYGIFVSLIASVAVLVGGILMMREEPY